MADADLNELMNVTGPVDAILIAELRLSDYRQEAAIWEASRDGDDAETDEEIALRMAGDEWAARLNILRDRAVADAIRHGNDGDVERIATPAEDVAEIEAAKEPVRISQCVLCLEQFEDRMLVTLPCNRNHHYCTGCVTDLFRRSFVDEGLFPPRCCQQAISIDLVDDILTPEMVATYHAKRIEIGTANRVYCCNRECSVFLPPQEGAESLLCERCETRTCTTCKNASHEGDCPEDEAAQALRALADQEGWKRCPRCGRTIELTHGCYHMTFVSLFPQTFSKLANSQL